MKIEFITIDHWDERVWNKVRSIYHESFEHGVKPENIIKKMFINNLCILHIGMIDSDVVCMALTGVIRNGQTLLIDYLAVSKDWRNKGIGRKTIEYIENWAITERYDSILIEVESEKTLINSGRIKFWERCGFALTDYIHDYKVVPEPYQAMYKKIDANSTLPSSGEKLFKMIEKFHRNSFLGKLDDEK